MIIKDLPTGSLITFMANLFTSFFFQFVGFLLTYLLHTTHAAKFGSRAGLGLTLIQYGFYSRTGDDVFSVPPTENPPGNQLSDTIYASTSPNDGTSVEGSFPLNINSREWLSFLLMTLGKSTVLERSLADFAIRMVYSPIFHDRFLACKTLGVIHPCIQCTRTDNNRRYRQGHHCTPQPRTGLWAPSRGRAL